MLFETPREFATKCWAQHVGLQLFFALARQGLHATVVLGCDVLSEQAVPRTRPKPLGRGQPSRFFRHCTPNPLLRLQNDTGTSDECIQQPSCGQCKSVAAIEDAEKKGDKQPQRLPKNPTTQLRGITRTAECHVGLASLAMATSDASSASLWIRFRTTLSLVFA